MATSDSLRTKETADAYRAFRATGALDKFCPLCDKKSIQEYKFWKIVPNDFPYDLIAAKHDMIVPLRHAKEDDLTPEEISELKEIKESTLINYEFIIEATNTRKSIPTHFHLHLINTKTEA